MTERQRIAIAAKVQHIIACPFCGKGEHQVGHLMGEPSRLFGPWYCDECGRGWLGKVVGREVEWEPSRCRKVETRVTLRLEPEDAPITLIVDGIGIVEPGESEGDILAHQEYFYNEHTCPTNYLGQVDRVIDKEGNDDPHGIFRFVTAEILPPTGERPGHE